MNTKTVLITGTNRGIGKVMVTEFAKKGYNVIAHARNQYDGFEELLSELSQSTGQEIIPVYFDLQDPNAIKKELKTLIKDYKIDVLINNAGVAYGGLMMMTSLDKMHDLYDVNVFAPVLLMQLVSRQMMRNKSGVIINMCSVGGIETNPGYLAYGSSKAALIWITKCVSRELGRYNIRVNGIAPGLIDTEMGHVKSDDELKKVIDRSSLHRTGKSEEIAHAALYLASDEASYMTGQIMILDGGRV